jgi:uroporphyrinogen decarboxylase
MDSIIAKAIKQQKIPRPPVWLMRQAGRYLEEYRALKQRHTFEELCSSSELAFEISMQPIQILDVDAAILFADILTPLKALGINVTFNPGPCIANPIQSSSDIEALKQISITEAVPSVFKTITAIKEELNKNYPDKGVIGFCGTPWTLACYLIDQGPIKHFQGTSIFLRQNRSAFCHLLEKLTKLNIDYCIAQIEAGAEVIQLFDSWGGILSGADYLEFSLPYIQKIISSIKQSGALAILYVNGSAHLLNQMKQAEADCYSLDWKTSVAEAKNVFGPSISLQGNLDPCALYDTKAEVKKLTKEMLATFGMDTGYIANLGHGILQTTPRENVLAFVDTVKNYV